MSPKDSRTPLNRQLHFMEFIKTMKIGNNVAVAGFLVLTRNTIMTCYGVHLHLAVSHTLLYKSIKTGTVFCYLPAAVDLSRPAQMMNPTINIISIHLQFITDLLRESKR